MLHTKILQLDFYAKLTRKKEEEPPNDERLALRSDKDENTEMAQKTK